MNTIVALPLIFGLAQASRAESAAPPPPDSLQRFPVVEGTNLEGRNFTLPKEFEGRYNVVLVAFKREQQDDVDSWMPFLHEAAAHHGGDLRVYELPTLGRRYRVVRGWIDGGMARGIPERATRQATITLYINKSPFRRALDITTEDRISVLLVSRDGHVLWRADGPFTSGSGADLTARLEALP